MWQDADQLTPSVLPFTLQPTLVLLFKIASQHYLFYVVCKAQGAVVP